MDPIADLLGGERPVALRPCLVRASGSLAAGVLLAQFWYWTNNPVTIGRDGWFYKTMKDIEEETGMSRSEQETARRKLRDLGIVEEDKRGIPMKIWFRLDKARLAELLRRHIGRNPATNLAGIPQDDLQQNGKIARDNGAGLAAGIPQAITETTAETTAEITSESTAADSAPAKAEPPAASEASAAAELVKELTDAGVNRADAERLAKDSPEECRRQLAFLPSVTQFKSSKGAYLRAAIEGGYGPPRSDSTTGTPPKKRSEQYQDRENAAALRVVRAPASYRRT